MKKIFFTLLIAAAIILSTENKAAAQTDNSPSVLRHIVMITFKKDASADSVKALDNIYISLSKDQLVKDFEMGVNMSPRDTGVIKHVFMTTFSSKEDMDTYKKSALYKTLFKAS